MKYPYLVTMVGVALMAITWAFGAVRAMMVREAFRPGGGLGGNRQFSTVNPFGLTSALTIPAMIIAILGLVWLGLALRKSQSPK